MLHLFVLRHAKAAIALPGMKDFDRGLTEHGSTDAAQLAKQMKKLGFLPQQIICSPSRRTRMTLHGVMNAFDDNSLPNIEYEPALYSGDTEDYLNAAKAFGPAKSGMLIGHNPMCEIFSASLALKGNPHALSAMRQKFPTCALAVFKIDAENFADVGPDTAFLEDFLVPAD